MGNAVEVVWEDVISNNGEYLRRAKIHGGWLVKVVVDASGIYQGQMMQGVEYRSSLCFVPDPNHEWK